ncbi:hypothetical protein DY78_GL002144 [Lactiplantibacillus fabifermentans DSM 21115]|uniref:Uncharacterized protein n=1 Tax=Lactiplantibacillus fabifermentans DSM 21115 TaxID=1413187 RepID=A0A0R2NBX1_9LACO|nr:hypothetical protein DY78_GL002144 [Lactiplantibacillus fabifermentans DSM 21115]
MAAAIANFQTERPPQPTELLRWRALGGAPCREDWLANYPASLRRRLLRLAVDSGEA